MLNHASHQTSRNKVSHRSNNTNLQMNTLASISRVQSLHQTFIMFYCLWLASMNHCIMISSPILSKIWFITMLLQMFVRLFVDENLDRHVPISKQPKEKIQAIIDSCARQFPEYSERARKRIRTYLKSCRRTKRSREQAGLDINNVRL